MPGEGEATNEQIRVTLVEADLTQRLLSWPIPIGETGTSDEGEEFHERKFSIAG